MKKNSANQTNSGLDRDYITQWSYGTGETWTLLVPNAKGGASVPLSQNETAMSKANPEFLTIYQQLGQYWGEQPGTSGPVYVGAFVVALFVFSLFVVKGPLKWALLVATILSILLSWGKNFMPFTDFLDHVPMYAKFRTVASILVIAEFTIPLLAMLGLKRIVEEPNLLKTRKFYISMGVTAGICLLFALVPTLFFPDFVSQAEREALSQLPQEYIAPILSNLTEMRKAVFTADCWRSFWIIAVGVAVLLLYRAKKLTVPYMVGALAVLCLADMWQVNKRYLHDDMFVEKSVRDTPQEKTTTDELILQDKALDYRVLNLASNTFNENETSYYHKSIGGYHAAKLRRYQEMIDAYIAPEMQGAMKAIAEANGDMSQVKGDSIYPDNANQEIERVGKLDLRHEAVADKKFQSALGESVVQVNTSLVTLREYQPNRLTYDVHSDKGGVVVFSEIYYPGWTATIDGEPAELGRVNYILRALNVKPGSHEVVLDFHPTSVKAFAHHLGGHRHGMA